MLFLDLNGVAELCQSRVPESLQLEFKEKNNADHPDLESGDKKAIAKAVSSFANSGGGTLIFGIRTTKSEDVDVAAELKPIKEPERCRIQVEYVCKTNVSPEIPGLEVTALIGPQEDGVIVCEVPGSERRPHMSTAPGVHTYYRRTFQGDVPMTPFEVQEQILAVREAVLSPTAKLSRGANFHNLTDWVAIGFSFEFGIENIGTRACLNPFLRVRSSQRSESLNAYFDARLGVWKSNAPYGTLVHVDDAATLIQLKFVARVFTRDLRRAFSTADGAVSSAVRFYDAADDIHSATCDEKVEIPSFDFEMTFGAENATARKRSFSIDRNDVAVRVLTRLEDSIRDMMIAEVSPWRSDLLSRLREVHSEELINTNPS